MWLLGLVLAALIALLSSAALAARTRRSHLLLQRWQSAMQRLGLKLQRAETQRRIWRGKFEGKLVQADLNLPPEQGSYRITLRAGAGFTIPPALVVHGDSAAQTLGRLVSDDEQDLTLGDAAFDDAAVLPALDAQSCAALSRSAREQLLSLLHRGGSVREGRVVMADSWGLETEEGYLARQLRWLCKLAGQLSVPADALHERLARNARHDPAPAVRLQNLRFLIAPATKAPAQLVTDTARALLNDVHLPVQLLAALQLGSEGLPRLRALLATKGSPEPALAALTALQPQHAGALLDSVLENTSSPYESVRAEAARVLGTWAIPATEPRLLSLLSEPAPRVQLAAAQALGSFGSVAAVEHLLPLARALLDSPLRQAARAAVGNIQSRLGHAEAGQLSLAEPQPLSGAVSLIDEARARAGELSLAESDANARVSLAASDADAPPSKAPRSAPSHSPPR